MILIKFAVNNQRLRKITPTLVPAAASSVKCAFSFRTDDWRDVSKSVNFYCNGENYTVPLDENNMCAVPSEVLLSSFKVSVIGGDIVTNSINVTIDGGGEINHTEYEQLMELIRTHVHDQYITEDEVEEVLPDVFDAGKVI